MIPDYELRRITREKGVPLTTVERDYAQNWLLFGLSEINMAFKGGTCIRKVYIEDYRFSDDLDFTLLEDVHPEELKSMLEDAVDVAKRESGISFEERTVFEENQNGYTFIVYFRLHRQTGDPMKIKLDITAKDREKVFLPVERKRVFHPYSDASIFNVEVIAYSLEEIFSEKIRALFRKSSPQRSVRRVATLEKGCGSS